MGRCNFGQCRCSIRSVAKKKVSKIAAEKMKNGEKKVGQFIHEVDNDFEL